MFERYYSCSIIAYCRYVMFQKRILSKPKWKGGGGGGGARPPWPPRSDGTGAWSVSTNQICPFVAVLSFEIRKNIKKIESHCRKRNLNSLTCNLQQLIWHFCFRAQ